MSPSSPALFELVERVTVLQEGRVLVEGTPDEIKGNSKVQEAYLGVLLFVFLRWWLGNSFGLFRGTYLCTSSRGCV
jgi:hypothetical protein